jgi:uncharacterized protein (TIGR03118 family)
MKSYRAALSGVLGGLCLIILQACGNGYGGGTTASPTTVQLNVSPSAVTLGQSAVLSWTATDGAACTASGAWSGAQTATGTLTVTPTAAGTEQFTLTCGGNNHSDGTASATLTVNAGTAFTRTSLTFDVDAGTGASVDPDLVNPWGLVMTSTSVVWIANTSTQTATLHDGNGKAQPQPDASRLVVQFAPSPAGAAFAPTDIIANASAANFIITFAQQSAPAAFVFAGAGGMIAGWAPTIDRQHAITMYTDAAGAVYRGLASATNAGATFLYATDIHNNKIDVFNAAFEKQPTSPTSFSFTDPAIPAGFAPFGIQEVSNGPEGAAQLYVTYAKQLAPDNRTGESGAGLGYVDVFDLNGKLVKQLIAGGALNAPWGLALAPADFGSFANSLLIANTGDGKINAYDAASGAVLGTLTDVGSAAIVSTGLHGIAFGNDANNQPHNTLFFTAGGQDGVFGRIDLGGTPPVLNAPPVVTLTVPAGTLAGTVPLSAAAADPLKLAKIEFQANGVSIGAITAAPFTIQWDTTTIADGQVSLKAIATDADGNVGSSAVSVVTVTNSAQPPGATLTQLQTEVFTPVCSGCHSGVGTALPGVMNLTAGNAFASLVNVQSLERPFLERVTPDDAGDSYIVQKLEGAAGIAGARMPFGCGPAGNPCLDPATVDRIKDWINHGAGNN